MTTTEITSDTTIYIIGAGDEPQWYAATETPEEAVAEAIAGIGLTISPDPFRVSKMSAADFAGYKDTLKGVRRAEQDADELRAYNHEKSLRLAKDIDGAEASSRVKSLDEQLAEMT